MNAFKTMKRILLLVWVELIHTCGPWKGLICPLRSKGLGERRASQQGAILPWICLNQKTWPLVENMYYTWSARKEIASCYSSSYNPAISPTPSNFSTSHFTEGKKKSINTLQSTLNGFYLHYSTETSLAEAPNDFLGTKSFHGVVKKWGPPEFKSLMLHLLALFPWSFMHLCSSESLGTSLGHHSIYLLWFLWVLNELIHIKS